MIPWILCASLLGFANFQDDGKSLSFQLQGGEGFSKEGVEIQAHLGLARFELSPEESFWRACRKYTRKTDSSGKASFDNFPKDGHVTVFARVDSWFGMASGPCQDMDVVLQEGGSLVGKVKGKKLDFRFYSVVVLCENGFTIPSTPVNHKTGEFEILGVPPGRVEVRLQKGRWIAQSKEAKVVAGKQKKIVGFKITDEFQLAADPMVDTSKVVIQDASGKPQKGVRMWWSAPHLDGANRTNEDGEIRMAGGNVSIGPPPFVLRLASLEKGDQRFLGEFRRVKRGRAYVRMTEPLYLVKGQVTWQGEGTPYHLVYARTQGKNPRHWWKNLGEVEIDKSKGEFYFYLPEGEHQILASSVDGEVLVHDLVVTASEETPTVTLALPATGDQAESDS
ncbi:MAG: hypothetical protein DWQ01_09615 [Planctomycetota bacterium]|nr:MAG: hypothetical protein DWQ01_09615 [Planctomycetota bacterium]